MKKLIPICALVFSIFIFSSVGICDSDFKFKGEGKSLIFNNDIDSAKKKALDEAFKDVLQKGVGVYIKTKTEVKDFQVTYDKILSESEGYIKNFNIIREGKDNDFYLVSIEANVSDDKIDQAFSRRLAKFMEDKPFGITCVYLYIIGKGTISSPLGVLVGFILQPNDPTIEYDSIYIKGPVSGWIKPSQEDDLRHLSDIIVMLEGNNEIDVKFKYYGSNDIKIHNIKFDKFCDIQVSDGFIDIFPRAYRISFNDINKDDLKKLISYLKTINTREVIISKVRGKHKLFKDGKEIDPIEVKQKLEEKKKQ